MTTHVGAVVSAFDMSAHTVWLCVMLILFSPWRRPVAWCSRLVGATRVIKAMARRVRIALCVLHSGVLTYLVWVYSSAIYAAYAKSPSFSSALCMPSSVGKPLLELPPRLVAHIGAYAVLQVLLAVELTLVHHHRVRHSSHVLQATWSTCLVLFTRFVLLWELVRRAASHALLVALIGAAMDLDTRVRTALHLAIPLRVGVFFERALSVTHAMHHVLQPLLLVVHVVGATVAYKDECTDDRIGAAFSLLVAWLGLGLWTIRFVFDVVSSVLTWVVKTHVRAGRRGWQRGVGNSRLTSKPHEV